MLFNKEDTIDTMIDSFDFPTTISPDVKKDEVEYELLSLDYTGSMEKLMEKYDLKRDNVILSLFLFNLVKFSFSKDILVVNFYSLSLIFNEPLFIFFILLV